MVIKKSCLEVKTDLNALQQVLVWFDQFALDTIPRTVWLQCQLALAEGFTNAVRHAHQHQPLETPITIEVTLLEAALEIRIWDHGPGFNLAAKLQEMDETLDHDQKEGGRGLKLIQKIADQVSYTQESEQRHCLLIQKSYGSLQ